MPEMQQGMSGSINIKRTRKWSGHLPLLRQQRIRAIDLQLYCQNQFEELAQTAGTMGDSMASPPRKLTCQSPPPHMYNPFLGSPTEQWGSYIGYDLNHQFHLAIWQATSSRGFLACQHHAWQCRFCDPHVYHEWLV